QRVERRLDGEVELRRRLRLLLRERGLLVRGRLVVLARDQVDPVVDQVGVEVLDLLLRELDLFEPADDLVVAEEPFLLSVLDELVQFLDVRQRDVDRQQERPPGFSDTWTRPFRTASSRLSPGPPSACCAGSYTRLTICHV